MENDPHKKTLELSEATDKVSRKLARLLTNLQTPATSKKELIEYEQLQQEGEKENALADQLERESRLKNDRYKAENKHWDDIYGLRKKYVPRLFIMVVGWLAFVIFCVVGVGFKLVSLSDAVLIALITTSTATVIGVFIVVAQWLFPKTPKDKD